MNDSVSITARSTGGQDCAFLYMCWKAKSSRRPRATESVERSRSNDTKCQVSFRPESQVYEWSRAAVTLSCKSIRDLVRHSCQRIIVLASAACQPWTEISAYCEHAGLQN